MVIMLVQNDRKELKKLMNCVSNVCPKDVVVGFDNPEHAIDYAETKNVDMCFADVLLQKSSGLALTQELRDINKDIRVNLLAEDKQYAVDAWMHHVNHYIIKPVTKDAVKETISE